MIYSDLLCVCVCVGGGGVYTERQQIIFPSVLGGGD